MKDWKAAVRTWEPKDGKAAPVNQNSIAPKKTWREMAREQGVNV